MAESGSKGPTKQTMAPAAQDPDGAGRPAAKRSGDGTTQDEFEASVERLSDEEFANLEAAIQAARSKRAGRPSEPSFGMSEGTRNDLVQMANRPERERGPVTSPFTGAVVEGDRAPADPRKSDTR
jgi:hypothetical protein